MTAILVAATAPGVGGAQAGSDEPPVTVPISAEDRLRRTEHWQNLSRSLDEIERTGALGAETAAQMPVLRAACWRFSMEPETTTEIDEGIARAIFVYGQRARDPKPGAGDRGAELQAAVRKAMPPAARTPGTDMRVEFGERRIPGRANGKVGYVTLTMNGKKSTIAEVPAYGPSPRERARIIAGRVEEAARRDSRWHLRLRTTQLAGLWVVASDAVREGYILTVDPNFARLRQMAPPALARRLQTDIRRLYSGPSFVAKGRSARVRASCRSVSCARGGLVRRVGRQERGAMASRYPTRNGGHARYERQMCAAPMPRPTTSSDLSAANALSSRR